MRFSIKIVGRLSLIVRAMDCMAQHVSRVSSEMLYIYANIPFD